MREFTLARIRHGPRRKMGVGEAGRTSSKIPVGSDSEGCVSAWDKWRNVTHTGHVGAILSRRT